MPPATTTSTAGTTPMPGWRPARPDCPAGWWVYNDPDGYFSLCHPPELLRGADNWRPSPFEGIVFTVTDPENQGVAPRNVFSLRLYHGRIVGVVGMGSAGQGICANYDPLLTKPTWTGYVEMTIDGRTAFGCDAEGPSGRLGVPIRAVKLKAPARDAFVVVAFSYLGPDLEGTFGQIEEILATVRLRW